MVLTLRPAQQMELDEAGHPVEMDLTVEPDRLEVGFRTFPHPKAVHGDEHRQKSLLCDPARRSAVGVSARQLG